MSRLPRLLVVFTIACLPILGGCTLGPRQIYNTRLQYNEAVQRTFQEEILLNLVRLKYRDSPEFLTIGGIASQHTFQGSAAANVTIPEARLDTLGFGGSYSRTERPTISYTPARGEAFQKGLLNPIDVQTLQLLTRTGWRWDRILRMTVQYINNIDNATSAGGPTPELKPEFEQFRYLAQMLRQMQVNRHIELVTAKRDASPKIIPFTKNEVGGDFVMDAIQAGYTITETDEGLQLVKSEKYTAIIIHPEAKFSEEFQEVARLLSLDVKQDSPAPETYEVVSANEGRIHEAYAAKQAADNGGVKTVVASTRSLLEVMYYLSQGVQVPAEHQRCGLVTQTVDASGQPFDWSEMTDDLLRICSSKQKPTNTAVAVQYNGYWFFIDDSDLNSQSTFNLLIELFGIEVRAGGGSGFLYTLDIGG